MKNETIRKLKNMRLPAFSEAYQKQIEDEMAYQEISFHERLALLVDAEHNSRHNNNIIRLMKGAYSVMKSPVSRSSEVHRRASKKPIAPKVRATFPKRKVAVH